jgi:hypothetical protein
MDFGNADVFCSLHVANDLMGGEWRRLADTLNAVAAHYPGSSISHFRVMGKKRKNLYRRSAVEKKHAAGVIEGLVLHDESRDNVSIVLMSTWQKPTGTTVDIRIERKPDGSFLSEEYDGFQWLVDLLCELAVLNDTIYGFIHCDADMLASSDYGGTRTKESLDVKETWWANMFGEGIISRIGRERVLTAPSHTVRELPCGSALVLTAASPFSWHTARDRWAQTALLNHLRPGLDCQRWHEALMKRSERTLLRESAWDPDIVPVYRMMVKYAATEERYELWKRLNETSPAPVSEFSSIDEALARKKAIGSREVEIVSAEAEWFLERIPKAHGRPSMDTPSCLARLDHMFHYYRYLDALRVKGLSPTIEGIGLLIGEMIVRNLGGKWNAASSHEDSFVVAGNRAWYPFRRAAKFVESQQTLLTHSLWYYYRQVEKHVQKQQRETTM